MNYYLLISTLPTAFSPKGHTFSTVATKQKAFLLIHPLVNESVTKKSRERTNKITNGKSWALMWASPT